MTLLRHDRSLPGHNRACEAVGHRARGPGGPRNNAGGAGGHRQPALHGRPRGGRAARFARPPSTWTASTARPPSGCCAAGRARPATGGLARVAPARAAPAADRAARALPGGAGRPAQRDRDGARPGARLRGRRRALRHEGHPRVRGRERRRVGHRGRGRARQEHPATAPHGAVRLLRRRGEPARRPSADFEERACAAARSRRRRSRRARDGPARLRGRPEALDPARGQLGPGLWRKLRAAARRVGAGRVFPTAASGSVLDDHIPFLERGRPVDRPDRLQLPLLAPPLRRHVRGLGAERRRGRGDRAASCCGSPVRCRR